jgi:hypothetical protein
MKVGSVRAASPPKEFFESIIKTHCTLVGLGAGFVYDFQRF